MSFMAFVMLGERVKSTDTYRWQGLDRGLRNVFPRHNALFRLSQRLRRLNILLKRLLMSATDTYPAANLDLATIGSYTTSAATGLR